MKNNNPPNGHSHINDRMAQAIRQREGQLRQALGQIQQMSLAIQSVSTLAALYKAQLQDCLKQLKQAADFVPDIGEEQVEASVQRAEKLLAAGHMEPVNEILRLRAELEKANALTGSQANMLEQMEKEVRDKTASITDNLREIEDLEAQIKTKNAKIEELGGYVGDI